MILMTEDELHHVLNREDNTINKMENDDSDSSGAIICKRSNWYINVDYMKKLARKANDIAKLKVLLANIDEEEEMIFIGSLL